VRQWVHIKGFSRDYNAQDGTKDKTNRQFIVSASLILEKASVGVLSNLT
jgi:hypothetical protein